MSEDFLEEVLRKVQEETLRYLMSLVRLEEIVDLNVSISFEEGVLNIDVQISLHEASLKNPSEIVRKVAQYAIKLFDEVWREKFERGPLIENGERG
ncbi:MAG: hypothetical protein QXQ20_07120 [Candidatus Nezhaarchaeales archaeon]|nr:MAG: hypothetical protein DSO06_05380 [Candidatus Nezhaarchaeota archaeon WYZ-LMO8]TDA36657.1 MAG: hypothetical protein DSO05_02970 [Candidatus Nezhaarchaeota archaeon WYZ-LMO7]